MLSSTDGGVRENNLNLLRLLAASLVTLSHAWPLTGSSGEPLAQATGNLTFGKLAVHIFFAISGFLITRSFDRSVNLPHFLRARALRIYPGLTVALLLSVVCSQLLTGSLPNREFFLNPSTIAYVKNNLMFNTQYDLPGIFTTNHFAGSVNGSLWTLRYEVAMYLGVTLAGMFGTIRHPFWFNLLSIPLVALSLVKVAQGTPPLGSIPEEGVVMAMCFYLGTAMYVNRHRLPLDLRILALLWIFAVSAKGYTAFYPLYALALTYSVLVIGFLPGLQSAFLSLRNDYSYGIYIYSFPIQQLLVFFQPSLGPWLHFTVAYLLVVPIAFISWHAVEKPALKMK